MFKHNKTNHIEQRRLPVLCRDVEREATWRGSSRSTLAADFGQEPLRKKNQFPINQGLARLIMCENPTSIEPLYPESNSALIVISTIAGMEV